MPRCRECNLIVNATAEHCPRCGTPVPARFRVSGRRIFIVVVALIISAVALRNGGSRETAPTKVLAASASGPFQVAIEASVSGDARPMVTGTTNLPDGMQLMVWLVKPWLPDGKERLAAGLPACGDDDCFPLQTYTKLPNAPGFGVVVKNGRFSDGPFDYKGAALRSGNYVLAVMSFFASAQPPEVRAVIGQLGENMTGPLVGGCCFGSHQDQAEIQKQLDDERRSAPVLGASIYYARYVQIGQPQQSNAVPSPAATLAQSEVNALRAKLMALWAPPAAVNSNPDKFVITLRINLGRDRYLAAPPVVLTNGQGAVFGATRDSAIQAIIKAQPYDMLQDASYDAWKEIEFTFDPREAAHPATGAAPPPASAPQRTAGFPAQKWKRVEADNGAAYAIDMNSISRSGPDVAGRTQADAVVCVVENDACDIMNMRRWIFYCSQNHVMELTDAGFTPSVYVPPLSIGRRVLDIACGR
jgi:hypothetical protein